MELNFRAVYHMYPLMWPEAIFDDDELISHDNLLRFLTDPATPCALSDFSRRYKEITAAEDEVLCKVPKEHKLMSRLVWPLRHAKSSFILGNHIGCIALCGMVSEMVAILTFELAVLDGAPMPAEAGDQGLLFGRSFERLDQFRRVDVLRAYGLIDETMMVGFAEVRKIRRKHLHLFSEIGATLESDAKECYRHTAKAVHEVIGHKYIEDDVLLYPRLTKYLERTGNKEDLDDTE